MSTENLFGQPIYSYSRQQAIEDGVLVDVSHLETVRQHWKFPFACTATVWAIIERALQEEGQDVNGIFHDIGVMAKLAARANPDHDRINFEVIITQKQERFKLHIGPGDTAAPVLTLMLPNED